MGENPYAVIEVRGRPATFATAHEQPWKQAIREAIAESELQPRPDACFKVRVDFRTPVARTAKRPLGPRQPGQANARRDGRNLRSARLERRAATKRRQGRGARSDQAHSQRRRGAGCADRGLVGRRTLKGAQLFATFPSGTSAAETPARACRARSPAPSCRPGVAARGSCGRRSGRARCRGRRRRSSR